MGLKVACLGKVRSGQARQRPSRNRERPIWRTVPASNRGQNRAACGHTGPRYQGESFGDGRDSRRRCKRERLQGSAIRGGRLADGSRFQAGRGGRRTVPAGRLRGSRRTLQACPGRELRGSRLPIPDSQVRTASRFPSAGFAVHGCDLRGSRRRRTVPGATGGRGSRAGQQGGQLLPRADGWLPGAMADAGDDARQFSGVRSGLRRCAPVRRIRNGSRHGPGNRSR